MLIKDTILQYKNVEPPHVETPHGFSFANLIKFTRGLANNNNFASERCELYLKKKGALSDTIWRIFVYFSRNCLAEVNS